MPMNYDRPGGMGHSTPGLPAGVNAAMHGPLLEIYRSAVEDCGFSHDVARELAAVYFGHLLDVVSEPHHAGAGGGGAT